jgi:hypothetical protein
VQIGGNDRQDEEYSIYVYDFASVSRHTDLVGVHSRSLMEHRRDNVGGHGHTHAAYTCACSSPSCHFTETSPWETFVAFSDLYNIFIGEVFLTQPLSSGVLLLDGKIHVPTCTRSKECKMNLKRCRQTPQHVKSYCQLF